MTWGRVYNVITDKKLTRRVLAIVMIIILHRIVVFLTQDVEKLQFINEWSASVLIAIITAVTLVFYFYFKVK